MVTLVFHKAVGKVGLRQKVAPSWVTQIVGVSLYSVIVFDGPTTPWRISRSLCGATPHQKGRKPLFRSLRLVRRLFVVFGFAIKKADGIGDALDNGLLDGDFDGFVLVGGFHFAVV
jgi:hypothetical protein